MALSGRLGLASTCADTGVEKVHRRDWNGAAAHRLAIGTVLARALGGEGVYRGKATLVSTTAVQADGTTPLILCVLDDSGYAYWGYFASNQTITFDATSGTLSLYAVPKQASGVSPAIADGGLADFDFIARSTAAPAHSLLLGSGSVTASSFTSFTEETTLRVVVGHVAAKIVSDVDADTKIQVEESADEDKIRFDTGGTERAVLDSTKLDLIGVGLDVDGNVTLGDASTDTITATGRLKHRQVTDAGPMTATAGDTGEIVFNTSDSKFYGCTAGGSPATWAALH